MGESRRHSHPRVTPAHGSDERDRSAIAVSASGLVALVPTFVLLAPGFHFAPVGLALTLAAIALFGYFGAVAMRGTTTLDASFVVALVALVLIGPLPAAMIWIATEIGAYLLQHRRVASLLGNSASFGWAVLVGSVVLTALVPGVSVDNLPGPAGYAGIAAAGIAMLLVNYLVATLFMDVVRDGKPFLSGVREELIRPLPATLAMVALGTVAIALYAALDVLALALFAIAVLVPQLLSALLRPRPVSELDHAEAVCLYADTIGRTLGMGRAQQRVLRDASRYVRDQVMRPTSTEMSAFDDGHRLAIVEAVLFHREHWDGPNGIPGAVGGEMIPLSSRVLAVADAWAGLTAKSSPHLSHSQVLNQLEARAGMHFDPRVVAAAAKVVAEQNLGEATGPAFQPSVGRLRIPRTARRLGAESVSAA